MTITNQRIQQARQRYAQYSEHAQVMRKYVRRNRGRWVVSILERFLTLRGPALPPGSYDADIGTVSTPMGPDGPAHFKARIYDADGELLGKYVFHTVAESVFRAGSGPVAQPEALGLLDRSDHWVPVIVDTSGELREMDLSQLRPTTTVRLTSASSRRGKR